MGTCILVAPGASPVERLLVGRVVACWLQLHYFDTIAAQAEIHEESPKLAQRQEQAHRMYLSALAALTTLRRLLPPTAKVIAHALQRGQPDAAAPPQRRTPRGAAASLTALIARAIRGPE
jgi:hypothetical protein